MEWIGAKKDLLLKEPWPNFKWISVKDFLPNHDSAVWVRDTASLSMAAYDPKEKRWIQVYPAIIIEYWAPADLEADEIYRNARNMWEQCKGWES